MASETCSTWKSTGAQRPAGELAAGARSARAATRAGAVVLEPGGFEQQLDAVDEHGGDVVEVGERLVPRQDRQASSRRAPNAETARAPAGEVTLTAKNGRVRPLPS
jgi:hypothetical protein